jgi:hypothetical protein
MASIADRVYALARRLRSFGRRHRIVRWLAIICAGAIFSALLEASHLREHIADAYQKLSSALLDVRPRTIISLYIAALSPDGSPELVEAPPVGHWAATCFGLCDVSQISESIGHVLYSKDASRNSGAGLLLLGLWATYVFLGSFVAFADIGYHLMITHGLLAALAVLAHFAIGFWVVTRLQRQWRVLGAIDADENHPGRASRYYRVFKRLIPIGCCGWLIAIALVALNPPVGLLDEFNRPVLMFLLLVGWFSVVAIMAFRDASGRKRVEKLLIDYSGGDPKRVDAEAIAHSSSILKVDPKNADAHYRLGMAYANKYFSADAGRASEFDYEKAISNVEAAADLFLKRHELAERQEALRARFTLEARGRPEGILAIFDIPFFLIFALPFTPVWTVIVASVTCWLAEGGLSLVDYVAGESAALVGYGATLGGVSWALFSKAVEERLDKLLERVIEE